MLLTQLQMCRKMPTVFANWTLTFFHTVKKKFKQVWTYANYNNTIFNSAQTQGRKLFSLIKELVLTQTTFSPWYVEYTHTTSLLAVLGVMGLGLLLYVCGKGRGLNNFFLLLG